MLAGETTMAAATAFAIVPATPATTTGIMRAKLRDNLAAASGLLINFQARRAAVAFRSFKARLVPVDVFGRAVHQTTSLIRGCKGVIEWSVSALFSKISSLAG